MTTICVLFGGLCIALAQNNLPTSAPANSVVLSSQFIDRLVEDARTNNPSLKAADARVRSAAFNAEAVRAWEDPTAMFGVNVFSPQGFSPSANGDLVYGVQEKLPLWGMPKVNREVAAAGVSTRQAQADVRFQQLRDDITKALVVAALTEEVVNIEEQDLEWLRATSKAVEAKYRSGQGDVADTLQIQNAAAVQNDQLRTDRLELAHDYFMLNRLLNRHHDSPWPPLRLPPVAPPVPYSAKLVALALTNEPNLKVVEKEIKEAEATAERTKRTRLPDVALGVQGWQYSGDGGFRQGMFTLSFSLPWFNGGKYGKDYARDRETIKSAQQEREDQILMVREEVHHLTVDLDAKRRQALLYGEEISIRAEEALTDKLTLWGTAKVTLRDVLDARRDALDAQLRAARATAGQYQTIADLMLWSGLESFESLIPLSNEPTLNTDH
ncbi:MAG TPA: TolC family protein [Candidatus Saccharimonadales bacterium]|nr:TolC family protein [Candidatus Saccharimonadales bacterium]